MADGGRRSRHFVELAIPVLRVDAAAYAEVGAVGLQFAQEPILWVIVLAIDEEVRMFANKVGVRLDVGSYGEELSFERHSFKDGGVGKLHRGGRVCEIEDAAKQFGRFSMIHFKKGKAATVDERQGGVDGVGQGADLARLDGGLGGAEGMSVEEDGQTIEREVDLAGDEQSDDRGQERGTEVAGSPPGEKTCGEKGGGEAGDNAIAREKRSVGVHEKRDLDGGESEHNDDGGPLSGCEEEGAAAAEATAAEQEQDRDGRKPQGREFAVDVAEVEDKDVFAGGLKGKREAGGCVVAQQGQVGEARDERQSEGEHDGEVRTATAQAAGQLRRGERTPGKQGKDVAEQHGSHAEDKGKQGDGPTLPRIDGALPMHKSEHEEGEQQGVRAGQDGYFAGKAREEQRRREQAEKGAHAAAYKRKQGKHRDQEGQHLRQAAGEGLGGDEAQAETRQQIAKRWIEVDEADVAKQVVKALSAADVEGKQLVMVEQPTVRGCENRGHVDEDEGETREFRMLLQV